ncbi:toluenesulfonate zinc-independent alcohol dehydrogenase TsaC [Papiliotrema laurentii]|uniref:Toluenesulfonate zinc-independent alcohol dehydrogenase TsaC n=1 Tax=Papiliotrema laurentii TaxID=5418 RepID=A0AAD9CVX9_PAPLA|nr:toluenesulfonate zinc-independent alcohol dehydrogenase TsaC [Papiliotrema laurentii]
MTIDQRRVAIVTGAGSGFGAGIARKLASQGIAVIVADVAVQNGEALVEEMNASGGTATFIKTDVTSAIDWKATVDWAITQYGRLNYVVNNAGGTYKSKPVYETTEADFYKCIDLNLLSIFHSVHQALPRLQEAGRKGQPASMVNISSTGGVKGRPGLTWYSASKAAVISVTQSLAHEFASDQVRINCICPVLGNTPLMAQFVGEADTDAFAKTIPLGRFADPSDIANSTAFLLSDEANFLTGVILPVDGGRLA